MYPNQICLWYIGYIYMKYMKCASIKVFILFIEALHNIPPISSANVPSSCPDP